MTDLLKELKNIFSERAIDAAKHPREAESYGRDLWPISFLWAREKQTPFPPDYVVWPKSEEEIVKLIDLCRKTKTPLVPYALGSGVCQGAVPTNSGIICDLKKLDQVIEFNEQNLTCTVEPGMNGQLFEEYLNRKGFTLGHFPSSIYVSSVGGWVATRAAGQLSTYYGKIEDMVLSLRMALGNGEVVETLDAPRSAQGPDFNQIYIGNEGTLGIITQVTLKIRPYPKYRGFFAVKSKDVDQGLEFMRLTQVKGLTPAAVRLYDELDTVIIGSPSDDAEADETKTSEGTEQKKPSILSKFIKAIRHGGGLRTILRMAPITNRAINVAMKAMNVGCLLLFTFEGEEEIMLPQRQYIEKLAREQGLEIKGDKPAEYWWQHRYDVSYNTPSVFSAGAFLDTCEVATTWDKLGPLYYRIKEAVQNDVFIMAHFSHTYLNGNNIYFSFVGYESTIEKSKKKYDRVWQSMMDVCLEMDVAISHHHSIGQFKQKWLKEQMGNKLPLWQAIKDHCDPDGIMNPGKMGLAKPSIHEKV